jgi:hypothetical protein
MNPSLDVKPRNVAVTTAAHGSSLLCLLSAPCLAGLDLQYSVHCLDCGLWRWYTIYTVKRVQLSRHARTCTEKSKWGRLRRTSALHWCWWTGQDVDCTFAKCYRWMKLGKMYRDFSLLFLDSSINSVYFLNLKTEFSGLANKNIEWMVTFQFQVHNRSCRCQFFWGRWGLNTETVYSTTWATSRAQETPSNDDLCWFSFAHFFPTVHWNLLM